MRCPTCSGCEAAHRGGNAVKGETRHFPRSVGAPADLSSCPDQAELAERSSPAAASAREAIGRNPGHGCLWPEKYLHQQR